MSTSFRTEKNSFYYHKYGIEIGSDKSTILVNSNKPRPSSADIRMNGKTLEKVNYFKCLRSTKTEDGTSIKEVKIRLATPSHDKVSNTSTKGKKQRHQFSYKD